MKKTIALGAGILLAGSLYSQSLVELSRQEKTRREHLKASQTKIVTNADLAAVGKTAAVSTPAASVQGAPVPPGGNPGSPAGQDQEPTDRSSVRMIPKVLENGPTISAPGAKGAPPPGNLEARLKAAHDLVEELTTKMNQLWQEFYSANAMVPQSVIQQRMDELNGKLEEAQKQEADLMAQAAAKAKH